MLVLIQSIKVADRQRKDFGDIEGLADSFKRNGQLNPIIVDESMNLIAGERRLRAASALGWTSIEATLFSDLTAFQKKEIELEENIRRKDFTWQEESIAYQQYHDAWCEEKESWTIGQTAEKLGCSESHVSHRLMVARELNSNPSSLAGAVNISTAINIIDRARARAVDREIADIIDSGAASLEGIYSDDPSEMAAIALPQHTVIHADFFEWAKSYSGPPFHFLHMDPPYGIEHHESEQGGSERFGIYEDTLDTFMKFIDTLATQQDRLLSSKSHVMIWFSMKYYLALGDELTTRFPDARIQPFPLIWHKSDATGMAPDVTREPRRIYETALILSLGDRKIVKVTNNLFSHPVSKHLARHLSEKPEPMLRYFFQMFIDNQTRVLDPCCGAGSSLLAAASLGAESITGIDVDSNNVEDSEISLKKAQSDALLTLDSEIEL